MTPQNLEPLIQSQPFFATLSPDAVAVINGCAKLVVFHQGETMIQEGQEADYFYLIREGRVAINLHLPVSGHVTLQTLAKGDVLGWSWMIPPHSYDFDATAMELTRTIAFDARCLRAKCDEDPCLGYALLKQFTTVMTQRLRAARMQLLDMYGFSRGPLGA